MLLLLLLDSISLQNDALPYFILFIVNIAALYYRDFTVFTRYDFSEAIQFITDRSILIDFCFSSLFQLPRRHFQVYSPSNKIQIEKIV